MANEQKTKTAFSTIVDMLRKGGFTVRLFKGDDINNQQYGTMYEKSISICVDYDYTIRINTLITLVENYYAHKTMKFSYGRPVFYMRLKKKPKHRDEYRLGSELECNSTILMIHGLFNTGVAECVETY